MSEEAVIKRNRKAGYLMLAIVVVPMVLAYVMYHTGIGLTGKGQANGIILNPPRAVTELVVRESQALENIYKSEMKRWRIVVPITFPCEEACQQRLYLSRQVHIALHKNIEHVERLLVFLDEDPGSEFLEMLRQEHPGTIQVSARRSDFVNFFKPFKEFDNLATDNMYLVDSDGWVMMAYQPQHTGKHILDDIKKLLKLKNEQ